MNITSALTKNYENDSLAYPANTNPILPGLKRQLYRIYSSTHLLIYSSTRPRPREAPQLSRIYSFTRLPIYSSTHSPLKTCRKVITNLPICDNFPCGLVPPQTAQIHPRPPDPDPSLLLTSYSLLLFLL